MSEKPHINIKMKDLKCFRELKPFFDGGLAITCYSRCPASEFENVFKEYGIKEAIDGLHFTGYIYELDSRVLKEILKICEKYKLFFIVRPVMRGGYSACMFQLVFVINE